MFYFLLSCLLCRHLTNEYTKQIAGWGKSGPVPVAYVRTIAGRFAATGVYARESWHREWRKDLADE